MPFYESQPVIYPLHRLLLEVLSGEILVPRFQRPGTEDTWKPEQRGELLDSIYRGFPIGTILLWSTNEKVNTLSVLGGAIIPASSNENRRLRLVLDGHQRLSTLVRILGPGIEEYNKNVEDSSPQEVWVFEVVSEDIEDPSKGRFRLLKPGDKPEIKDVPLKIALDRVQLNEWVRARKDLTSSDIKLVDSLRDRFREYSIPVATLAAESLEVATETFKRINSSGTPMSDFHMVAALAYTNNFEPQEHFDLVRTEHLEPVGWGDVDDADILRVCAGLVRRSGGPGELYQHPAKLNIDRLGKALRDNPSLIEKAGISIAEVGELLSNFAGVHGPGILPYSWQLIVMAIEFGSRPEIHLSEPEIKQACRWFWLTTYGGVFASTKTTVVDRAGRALSDMLVGGNENAMQRDIVRQVEPPTRFDFRAARSRACLLAMARIADQGNLTGEAHHRLADVGVSTVKTLWPKYGRSWYNLVIEPSDTQLRNIRDAFRRRSNAKSIADDDILLEKVGIPANATGGIEELLQIRSAYLTEKERLFVVQLGLSFNSSSEQVQSVEIT